MFNSRYKGLMSCHTLPLDVVNPSLRQWWMNRLNLTKYAITVFSKELDDTTSTKKSYVGLGRGRLLLTLQIETHFDIPAVICFHCHSSGY